MYPTCTRRQREALKKTKKKCIIARKSKNIERERVCVSSNAKSSSSTKERSSQILRIVRVRVKTKWQAKTTNEKKR